jgi:hypothetical protein
VTPDTLLRLANLDASELAALRELHTTIVQLVDGLLSGRQVTRACGAADQTRAIDHRDVAALRGRGSGLPRAARVERTHACGNAGSPGCLGACRDRHSAPEALRARGVQPRLLRRDALRHAPLACRIAMREPRATTTPPCSLTPHLTPRDTLTGVPRVPRLRLLASPATRAPRDRSKPVRRGSREFMCLRMPSAGAGQRNRH